jgi:hypothetical protein
MSDVEDIKRFRRVAELFRTSVQAFGLVPVEEVDAEEGDTGGWWAKVATWRRDRPNVSTWFDRSLEQERQFWFGFQSRRSSVLDALVQELPRNLGYAEIGNDDVVKIADNYWRYKPPAVERVKRNDGRAFERYPEDDSLEGHYFGINQLGFRFNSEEQLVTQAAEFVGGIVECIGPSLEEEHDDQLKELKRENPTEYKQVILARRGQGRFRRELEQFWKGSCSVTGCSVSEALRASHIKPWRVSTNDERLDKNNGLLLNAMLDALFDKFLISFDDKGGIVISPQYYKRNTNYRHLMA